MEDFNKFEFTNDEISKIQKELYNYYNYDWDFYEVIFKRKFGIHQTFISNSLNYRDPLKLIKRNDNNFDCIYSEKKYHIIFIDYGIRIVMTLDFLKKIHPLNKILVNKLGKDHVKLLNFEFKSNFIKFKGPLLYITKLPIESLLIDSKPNIPKITCKTDEILNNWYEKDNIYNIIVNELWYK